MVLDAATVEGDGIGWDEIAALGNLAVYDRTPPELVRERARGAGVVLTNKTRLGADLLVELPALRLVSVLATGTDVVDVAFAQSRGVTVCNVPGYADAAVAQHVFALLLEALGAVGEHEGAVRTGVWSRHPDFSCRIRSPVELYGKTMGIVGLGRIGSRVARLAAAFGMEVVAWQRDGGGGEVPGVKVRRAGLFELLSGSDVVSLHCPLTPATRRLLGAGEFRAMKPSSILVNTARGGLLDENALAAALATGRPALALLDVLAVEPPPATHPLLSSPNCRITPHVAWASVDARRRLVKTSADNIRAFTAGTPINVVAPAQATRRDP